MSQFWWTVIAVTAAVLAAAFLVTQILFPRFVWRLGRWRYRNPDAVEPSTTMFWLRRIKAAVLLAVLIVGVVVVYRLSADLARLGDLA